jgi:hypothetical protein
VAGDVGAWEALYRQCHKQRGARLGTFLRRTARDVTARHFRTEIRRRERVAGKRHDTQRRATGEVEAAMAEFVDTLGPAEQAFLEQHLLGGDGSDGSGENLSEANFWQPTSRIRRKFHRFFHVEEEDAAPTARDGENRLDGNGSQAEAPADEDSGAKNLGAVRRRPR